MNGVLSFLFFFLHLPRNISEIKWKSFLLTGDDSDRNYQADNTHRQDFSFALEPENITNKLTFFTSENKN